MYCSVRKPGYFSQKALWRRLPLRENNRLQRLKQQGFIVAFKCSVLLRRANFLPLRANLLLSMLKP
jgi:hypothetical protein